MESPNSNNVVTLPSFNSKTGSYEVPEIFCNYSFKEYKDIKFELFCMEGDAEHKMLDQPEIDEEVSYNYVYSNNSAHVSMKELGTMLVEEDISDSSLCSSVSEIETNSGVINKERSEISRPMVTLISESDVINVPTDGTIELNCMLSVTTPSYYEATEMTPAEEELKAKVLKEMETKLVEQTLNWKNEFDTGGLLIFDVLDISTNEIDYDEMTCYLFEKLIALVNNEILIGQIFLDEICSINNSNLGFILNLANTAIPELHVRQSNEITRLKWEHYLSKYISNRDNYVFPNIPLYQITTNAWKFASKIDLPSSILEFAEAIDANSSIPSSLALSIIPSLDPNPLNLIVAISLLNNSAVENLEYENQLKTLLRTIKNNLRNIDKLGLIFVGVDKFGYTSKNGSFVGFIESTWVGWDDVISNIEVSSNLIGMTSLEEFEISIKKCDDLSLFLPMGANSISKFLMINTSSKITPDPLPIDSLSKSLQKLWEKLSIYVVRIGKSYDEDIDIINKVCATSQHRLVDKEFELLHGSLFLRYDSLLQFNSEIADLIEKKFYSSCVPDISTTICCNYDFVNITLIENNGGLVQFSNTSRIKIMARNLEPSVRRDILVRVKIDSKKFHIENPQSPDTFTLLTYQGEWLGNKGVQKNMDLKIMGYESNRMPNTEPNSDSQCITPSNESVIKAESQNLAFLPIARRKAELATINTLKLLPWKPNVERRCLLMNTISLIHSSVKKTEEVGQALTVTNEACIAAAKYKAGFDENYHNEKVYMRSLISELQAVCKLFDHDFKVALVRCQDLVYMLI